MKKLIATFLIMIIFIFGIGILGNFEHHYVRKNCEVVSIENGLVTVVDKTNNVWQFENDSFQKGDKVNLTMFDSATGTMYDDEIVKVEKCN